MGRRAGRGAAQPRPRRARADQPGQRRGGDRRQLRAAGAAARPALSRPFGQRGGGAARGPGDAGARSAAARQDPAGPAAGLGRQPDPAPRRLGRARPRARRGRRRQRAADQFGVAAARHDRRRVRGARTRQPAPGRCRRADADAGRRPGGARLAGQRWPRDAGAGRAQPVDRAWLRPCRRHRGAGPRGAHHRLAEGLVGGPDRDPGRGRGGARHRGAVAGAGLAQAGRCADFGRPARLDRRGGPDRHAGGGAADRRRRADPRRFRAPGRLPARHALLHLRSARTEDHLLGRHRGQQGAAHPRLGSGLSGRHAQRPAHQLPGPGQVLAGHGRSRRPVRKAGAILARRARPAAAARPVRTDGGAARADRGRAADRQPRPGVGDGQGAERVARHPRRRDHPRPSAGAVAGRAGDADPRLGGAECRDRHTEQRQGGAAHRPGDEAAAGARLRLLGRRRAHHQDPAAGRGRARLCLDQRQHLHDGAGRRPRHAAAGRRGGCRRLGLPGARHHRSSRRRR